MADLPNVSDGISVTFDESTIQFLLWSFSLRQLRERERERESDRIRERGRVRQNKGKRERDGQIQMEGEKAENE